MAVEEDATQVLLALATYQEAEGDPRQGRHSLDGTTLVAVTELDPDRLNDAVAVLDDSGYVELHRFLGTAPFDFGDVELNARGRREAERILLAAEAPAPTQPEPERLPHAETRFVALQRLGAGVYGEVWRANDERLRRLVAIKFVRSSSVEHDALAHARALARVTHPNIVAVYDVAEAFDPVTNLPAYAVVMELVEGPTLVERLGRTMTADEVRRVGGGLLDAVDAYHRAGLAHMDIHDGNVIVSETTVKLLDPLYLATGDMRSTATRESQQRRDARDVRDLLEQMLHLGSVRTEEARRFARETVRPTIGHLRRVLEDVLARAIDQVPQTSEPAALTPRMMLDRAIATAVNPELVVVGGVTELVGDIRRPAMINGPVQIGLRDELTFQIRVPIGTGGIPILTVPYGMMREAWVDAGGRLNVLLTSPVVWNGHELAFSDPFVR